MTKYPIVDPAEIAKLPPAVYETGLGAMCLSDDGVWTDFAGDRWSHTDLASSGGIAARLVPEAQRIPEELLAGKRLTAQESQAVYTTNTELLGNALAWKSQRDKAEAQRDRAVELLRDLAEDVDERVFTAFAIAGLVEAWLPKVRAFLYHAEQEKNDE